MYYSIGEAARITGIAISLSLIHIFGGAGNMLLRHHQDMNWRLGLDIPEGQHGIVLVHLIGRDLPRNDFTEYAVPVSYTHLDVYKRQYMMR